MQDSLSAGFRGSQLAIGACVLALSYWLGLFSQAMVACFGFELDRSGTSHQPDAILSAYTIQSPSWFNLRTLLAAGRLVRAHALLRHALIHST